MRLHTTCPVMTPHDLLHKMRLQQQCLGRGTVAGNHTAVDVAIPTSTASTRHEPRHYLFHLSPRSRTHATKSLSDAGHVLAAGASMYVTLQLRHPHPVRGCFAAHTSSHASTDTPATIQCNPGEASMHPWCFNAAPATIQCNSGCASLQPNGAFNGVTTLHCSSSGPINAPLQQRAWRAPWQHPHRRMLWRRVRRQWGMHRFKNDNTWRRQ